MSSNISFSGLASGMNTDALIQNLMRFNQQRIGMLNQDVQKDTTRQTTFQGVTNRLQSLKLTASQLAQPQNSVFDTKTVATSDSSVVTAAVGTGAQSGVTNLKVLSLAQSDQIASQGFEDPDSQISLGTLEIQAGSGTASLTIDSTNNTLSSLARSINDAGIGVTATIVNTGSDDLRTQPYRLMLSSNNTGTANSIKITNNLAATGDGKVKLNFATTEIGPAVTDTAFSGTSTVTSAGAYTGGSNDTFTFTVTTGGTVGTDDGIQLSYTNGSGTQTGTITVNQSDVDTAMTVVDGMQVQFAAGTLNAGDEFSIGVFSPKIQAAADAQVQLGSGSGAVLIKSASNTVTNLVPGVSIKLQTADPTKTVQLTVDNDVEGIIKQVSDFVDDYNDFAKFIDAQTKYTPGQGTSSGTAAPLNGIMSVRGLRTQVQQAMMAIAPDLASQMNRLGALGISPEANGQLKVDKAQLRDVLSGSVSGVTMKDVKALFSLQGESSSSGVQFATGTEKTKSSSTPYTVHITQAAQRASITGTNAIAGSTVIDSSNNTLEVTVNGKTSGTITLASGTYTAQGLTSELETEINAAMKPKGSTVSVTVDNGKLVVTSGRYGTASTVSVNSGTALADLGFDGTESGVGANVAGSFIVNGQTEAATGVGQSLRGNADNLNTDGLTVVVTLAPSQIQPGGNDSTMLVTRGIASSLNNMLEGMLDPVNGQITLIANQFTAQIQAAKDDVTKQTNAMTVQQTALLRQFATMEAALANLQAQSSLLSQFSAANASGGLFGSSN